MKKIIATVLSAVMLLSCAPVSVHAQAQTASDSVTHVQAERKGAAALGSSFGSAISLATSQQRVATLDSNGEFYFKYTTTSNSSFYTFYLNVRDNHSVNFEIYSDSYGSSEPVLAKWCREKTTNSFDLGKLEKNHTYYVKLIGDRYATSSAGDQVAVAFVERKDEVGDEGSSAKALNFNAQFKGSLQENGDADYFSFKTTKDDNFYDLLVSNYGTETTVYINVYSDVYSSDHLGEWHVDVKSNGVVNLGKLKKNHTYYVSITPYRWSHEIIDNAYTLRVKPKKDDVSDYMYQAAKIKVAKTVKKSIQDKSDVDNFTFKSLNKNLDYAVKVKNTGTSKLHVAVYKDKEETNRLDEFWVAKKSTQEVTVSFGKNKWGYIKIEPDYADEFGAYSLTVTPKPRGFKSSSGKGIKKGIKVSMKADGTVSGYQVKYRYGSKKYTTKTYKTSKSKITKTIKGLKRNTTYQVYVRTYYTYNKKKYYSEWSSVNDGWFGYDVYTK